MKIFRQLPVFIPHLGKAVLQHFDIFGVGFVGNSAKLIQNCMCYIYGLHHLLVKLLSCCKQPQQHLVADGAWFYLPDCRCDQRTEYAHGVDFIALVDP